MQQNDMNIFLQSLRGNQPMIVLAFLLVRSALSIEQLEILTGLHNDTVRAAVKGLASKGMLFKQTGEHGRNTWLPAGDTFFGMAFDQSPKFSDSASTATTTVGRDKKDKLAVVVINEQSPKFSDSGVHRAQLDEHINPHYADNLRMCMKVGIGQPKAKQVSDAMDPATGEAVEPEFIKAHVDSLQDGETIGLAIVRMLSGEMPRTWLAEIASLWSRNEIEESNDEDVDEVERKLVYIPVAMDHEFLERRRHNFHIGECTECHHVETLIGVRDGEFCFTCYDEWRKNAIGFYAHPDSWVIASNDDE